MSTTTTTAGPLPLDRPAPPPRAAARLASPAGRRFLGAAVLAAVMGLGFILVWIVLRRGGDAATTAFDDIGEAVAALIAAISCGYATLTRSGRLRLAWGLIGLSAFSWFIGEVIWSIYEVGLGQEVPFPSPADAGFLLAIPLAIGGIFTFPSAPSRAATRGKAIVDALIVALSLVYISWALGLANVYQTSADNTWAQLIGAAYPASDVVMIGVLLLVMRRAPVQHLGSMVLLLLGFASNAVADSAFSYLNAAGQYSALGSVLDAGWVVGYLLIALAPLWPAPVTDRVTPEGVADAWQKSVPWIALLGAAFVTVIYALTGHALDPFLTGVGGALGTLCVASSVLAHHDAVDLLGKAEHSEDQLRQRTDVLNQVITHAPLGVARVGVDLRILEANPRLGALLHAPERIMVGSLVSDYLSPEALQDLVERSQPMWRGEVDITEGDALTVRADGSDVYLHYIISAVRKPNGRIDYFLAMFEDITSRHEAEETTMANLAGLERLNQLKSEFVSMVSHEFRTALVGIQGFSEMLQSGDTPPGDVVSLATDINNDAQRLNRMIGEMLDLDRMEAGKIRLNPKPLDLNQLVVDTVERAQAATDQHRLVTDLDRALPIISGDSDRLVQVVSNLLTNAVKYSPDGGDVMVTTRAEDGVVHLSVIDHGVGIAPEFVSRLFGRYERFESNRTSKVVGTGLGLAISRQIIELHGGRIWVESKPGEGSNFQFTLPVRTTAATAATATA